MPRELDPNNATKLWLESDAAIPEDKRPTFTARHLTGRAWIEVAGIYDNLGQQESNKGSLELVFTAVRKIISGWENMTWPPGTPDAGSPMPFSPDNFELLLDPAEAVELLKSVMSKQAPGADTLKKSGSPSRSSSASSVSTAAAASATTSPTSASQ